MPQILVDRDRCKGCELCTHACPQGIIKMSEKINIKGYFFAVLADPGRCLGCRVCGLVCPDVAITVTVNAVQYNLFDY